MKINGITVGTTTKPKALGDKLGLENKLDKTTEANKLYGTDKDGNQRQYDVSENITSSGIAVRLGGGYLGVPNPTQYFHATPKEYVDKADNALSEKQTAFEERVTELESLTLTYIEDGSTAYEKVVPANIGSKALIKGIGGATERVMGKNLVNPADIQMPEEVNSYTINQDGTITYTIDYSPSGFAIIDLSTLPVGRYYFYVEGICNGIWHFYDSDIELYVMSDFDESLNEYLPTTRTLKAMLWRDESVTTDTLEVVEAPSGTVFEPYHEPYLRNVDVERIESLSKNRLPSEVYDIDNWQTHSEGSANKVFYLDDITEEGIYILSAKCNDSTGLYFYLQRKIDGGNYTATEAGVNVLGNPITGYFLANGIETNPMRFEHKKGYKWRLYLANGNQEKLNRVSELQIERGTLQAKPTAYTPYKAEPIDTLVMPEGLKLNAVNDTYYEYIEVKDNKILRHKNIFEYSFTGYEAFPWTLALNNNGTYRFYIKNSDNIFPACIGNVGICNQHTLNEIWDNRGAGNAGEFFVNSDGTIVFIVDDVSLTAGNNWKQHLRDLNTAGNPLTFRTALANPEVEDITHLFTTTEIKLLIERGGVLRFVNKDKIPVPSSVWFTTRKE